MSDFVSAEEAEAYDRWFRAKVEASLADTRPTVSHEEAMARIETIIEKARQASKRG
ncbi:type II toxin-antitoxin system RelB family antitoxin [Acidisoma silvae]|uniref:Antitoxin n=1 Tax=Acidisoma silvae TaxID=2802396 RepID=A0A964DXE5_9PROT|nr:antitoxin [Acidisoma silvae]MCB8874126.1 antitoxin [Acidisoma silvae]